MARTRNRLENNTGSWNANMRPRVGATTEHLGLAYSNATGRNAEPGTTNDWVVTGTAAAALRMLDWNGYRWYKKATNLNAYPAAGDEFQGRGDGRYSNGDYIAHSEILRDLPDGQAPDENLDIKIFNNYQ